MMHQEPNGHGGERRQQCGYDRQYHRFPQTHLLSMASIGYRCLRKIDAGRKALTCISRGIEGSGLIAK
jgi:hypothetical protein